jgi:hypothetical protein
VHATYLVLLPFLYSRVYSIKFLTDLPTNGLFVPWGRMSYFFSSKPSKPEDLGYENRPTACLFEFAIETQPDLLSSCCCRISTPTTSRDCLSINQDYRPSTAELLKLPTVRLTLARETQITKALKVQMKYQASSLMQTHLQKLQRKFEDEVQTKVAAEMRKEKIDIEVRERVNAELERHRFEYEIRTRVAAEMAERKALDEVNVEMKL